MTVEIIYETHSLTTDNEAGTATGWLPGELSARGRRLAVELGKRRRTSNVAAVFVSDLGRAVDTAQIAFGDSPIPIRTDTRLRECNYGTLNGIPTAQLAARRRYHIDEPYRGGQSYRQVIDQMREFLLDLCTDQEGRTVVVISHSANKWALDCLLHGKELEDLVDAPFGWQEGWRYVLPTGWPNNLPYDPAR